MTDKNDHISIDATNAQVCAVPKEKFRINHYNFGLGKAFEDLVHAKPPYFHFQVLRPENEVQRENALAYFKEHKKIYTMYVNRPEILLYLGCTESIYIRSVSVDFETDELKNIIPQANHWFRFYGNETKDSGNNNEE